MEMLSIKDVSLTYQTPESETHALKNITFSVSEGEFVSLVGAVRIGKTTIVAYSRTDKTYFRRYIRGR